MEIQNLHLCNTFFTPINVIRIPFLFYQKKIHFYYQPTSIAISYYLYSIVLLYVPVDSSFTNVLH